MNLKSHLSIITCIMILFQISYSVSNNNPLPEQTLKKNGDVVHVHNIFEGASIYSKNSGNSTVIRSAAWLENFVILKKGDKTNKKTGIRWINVGKLISLNEADEVGWMMADDLLLKQRALKDEGIFRKAMVITRWDQVSESITGATRRRAPTDNDNNIEGQELTLSEIYYVFDEREDFESDYNYYLLGADPAIMDPSNAENSILGWVNDNNLFPWDTRQAAEYDKSSLPRSPAKLFETKEDVESLIINRDINQVSVLATEDILKTDIKPEDPRFPILTEEEDEVTGQKLWNIGFVGDQIVGGTQVKSTIDHTEIQKIKEFTLQNPVDVMFVFDGSGSMAAFKDAVTNAVQEIQNGITQHWLENYPGEAKAKARFSVTMYRDYSETTHFKREPFTEQSQVVRSFIESHDFKGGREQPAVYNGIAQTLTASSPEFDPSSIRILILIGDMGNNGVNHTLPDVKGHTISSIAKHLEDNDCDFHAIHVIDTNIETWPNDLNRSPYQSFEDQSKSIIMNFPDYRAGYHKLIYAQDIKDQVVQQIIESLDQRYGASKVMKDVATGIRRIGSGDLSGTILEQRAIDIMERNGINPDDFVSQNVTPFGFSWVTTEDLDSKKRLFKPVILMDKEEVERLISLLGQMVSVSYNNVKSAWTAALESETGEDISADSSPAAVIEKHLGIPVKAGLLQMSINEISTQPASEITAAIKKFERKLFLLRAVINEQEVIIKEENGMQIVNIIGSKKYWFGTIGNRRVWLDADVYLP